MKGEDIEYQAAMRILTVPPNVEAQYFASPGIIFSPTAKMSLQYGSDFNQEEIGAINGRAFRTRSGLC